MKGTRAAEGVLFFFAMEFLQFFQYFWIADNLKDEKCKNIINQALTLAGFLHICLQVVLDMFCHLVLFFIDLILLQPYYTHVINAALTPNPDNKAHAHRFAGKEEYAQKMRYKHAKFSVILNLCLIAGALLFVRCALAMNGYFNTLDMSNDADISAIKPMQAPKVDASNPRFALSLSFHLTRWLLQLLTSTEWLRGDRLCTWKGELARSSSLLLPTLRPFFCPHFVPSFAHIHRTGNHHLAWSVPMSDPSYNIMGAGIHR